MRMLRWMLGRTRQIGYAIKVSRNHDAGKPHHGIVQRILTEMVGSH